MTRGLTPLRSFWLACAVLAAVVSLRSGGAGLPRSAPDWIGAAVLVLWCCMEGMVRRNWPGFLVLPALAFGLGCALPLHLFLRSAPVD